MNTTEATVVNVAGQRFGFTLEHESKVPPCHVLYEGRLFNTCGDWKDPQYGLPNTCTYVEVPHTRVVDATGQTPRHLEPGTEEFAQLENLTR